MSRKKVPCGTRGSRAATTLVVSLSPVYETLPDPPVAPGTVPLSLGHPYPSALRLLSDRPPTLYTNSRTSVVRAHVLGDGGRGERTSPMYSGPRTDS